LHSAEGNKGFINPSAKNLNFLHGTSVKDYGMSKHGMVEVCDNNDHHTVHPMGRRDFLTFAAGCVSLLVTSPVLAHLSTTEKRTLYFYNKDNNATVNTVYWTPDQGYLGEAFKEINWALRDHYNDQVIDFDPKLLDQLYALQLKMNYLKKPVRIISGYRSPTTNARLRRSNKRVAKNSFHMYGKAIDIYMPGRSVSALYRAARSLKAGGIGYYPKCNTIHLDTGPVRTWR
jgi:uncharacterized protein YcbK (DUF882 family)